jgi:hypothetical protein
MLAIGHRSDGDERDNQMSNTGPMAVEVRLRPLNESDLGLAVIGEWDPEVAGEFQWLGFKMDKVRNLEGRWRDDAVRPERSTNSPSTRQAASTRQARSARSRGGVTHRQSPPRNGTGRATRCAGRCWGRRFRDGRGRPTAFRACPAPGDSRCAAVLPAEPHSSKAAD